MPTEAPETWTTRRLMAWVGKALADKGVDSPRLCAEMLLSHVLGCDRLRLYADADRPASSEERDRLRALVARALRHEPVQYLVGEGWFFGLPFTCDKRALIPRPSTETIVETILQHERSAPAGREPLIADLCTGSGCIAVTLAHRLRAARLIATDISPEALELAAVNADRHAVADRIEFRQGDLLAPLAPDAGEFHYIASNPPYISDREWDAVEANVKDHEPTLALRAGADGLRFVGPIIAEAPRLLAPGGMLLVEIASCTEGETLEMARRHPLLAGDEPRILKDSDGLPRVLVARRPG